MPPPKWLPEVHHARHERLRQCRLLFAGRHRRYFLDERRTQFNYPVVPVFGVDQRPYVTVNLCRLLTLKTADLIFGAKPKLDAPSVAQADALDLLARRSMLHARLHQAAVSASWAGAGFLEATVWKGEPYVESIEPDEIYPLGVMGPDAQYERYVRFAIANVGTTHAPINLLLETWYEPGTIRRQLHQLDESGGKHKPLSLSLWPGAASALAESERTGLPGCSITHVPNALDGRIGVSDYDGLVALQDAVNAKFAQIARVLAKHADPKLAAPSSEADAKGSLRSTHDVYFFNSKEEIPFYITWSAELDAAMKDRDQVLDAFCMTAEVSQVLIGLKRGAQPEAARTMKLEATNTLSKVARKSIVIAPAIARAIEYAQWLDQNVMGRQYPVEPVGVEMRDGLPIDPLDVASEISTLRAAGVMSVEDAVERRKEDPDAVAVELDRLAKERAEATPTVLLGEPGEPAATDADNDDAEEAE